jgi:hypothetical protein
MVALRMAYMTHFPTQSQILSFIEPFGHKANTGAVGSSARPIAESKVSNPHALSPTHHPSQDSPLGQSTGQSTGDSDPEKTTKTHAVVWNQSSIASLDNLLLALAQAREGLLHAHVRSNVSWVGWDDTALVLHWDKTRGAMPKTFAASFDQFFKHHMEKGCHIRWNDTAHSLSQMAQEEQERAHYDALAKQNPGIQTILNTFPDATIEQITKL